MVLPVCILYQFQPAKGKASVQSVPTTHDVMTNTYWFTNCLSSVTCADSEEDKSTEEEAISFTGGEPPMPVFRFSATWVKSTCILVYDFRGLPTHTHTYIHTYIHTYMVYHAPCTPFEKHCYIALIPEGLQVDQGRFTLETPFCLPLSWASVGLSISLWM